MPFIDRTIRKVMNTKQESIEYNGVPSLASMLEGQTAIQKKSNTLLAIYRKKFGKLWKVYMSSDGNQVVDKNLTVSNAMKELGLSIICDTCYNTSIDGSTGSISREWFE